MAGRLFLSVVENGDTDGDNADDNQAKGKKPFVSNHSSCHSTAPFRHSLGGTQSQAKESVAPPGSLGKVRTSAHGVDGGLTATVRRCHLHFNMVNRI